ncbi:hypothetical protein M0R45_038163 [Rubus argutus]|uniref:Topoisomerase 6 subunit A/Spo11 TOPRIM domain-containing protein n=1 Tax=Rubus argutus TaxID=59490 RepID=A0AAW1W492_RUBAR
MPSRADGSQKFSIYLDSWVLLRGKEFKRNKDDGEQYKITYELVTLIYKLCTKLKSMKLREIYYSNTKLYKNVKYVGDQNYNGFAGGAEGINIPSDTTLIHNINSVDALFILVVEKDTIFERLADDGFLQDVPLYLDNRKGNARCGNQKLSNYNKKRAEASCICTMDCNPYGLRIYAVTVTGQRLCLMT